MRELPILTFHSVDPSGSMISVSPARFAKLMLYLKAGGFKTLLLPDVLAWLEGRLSLSERSVALTFDDGYENVFHAAFPILQEAGFKATLFLTAGYCGRHNDWPSQPPHVPRLPLLNWEQIREMAKETFDVQAHTCSHPVLTGLPPEAVQEELGRSRGMIEDRLGNKAEYFAYPYGKYNRRVYEQVRENFAAACSTDLRLANSKSDRHLLERVDMYYFSGPWSSRIFNTSGFRPYVRLRQLIRQARKKYNILL